MSSNKSKLATGDEQDGDEVDDPAVRRMQALISQWEADCGPESDLPELLPDDDAQHAVSIAAAGVQ